MMKILKDREIIQLSLEYADRETVQDKEFYKAYKMDQVKKANGNNKVIQKLIDDADTSKLQKIMTSNRRWDEEMFLTKFNRKQINSIIDRISELLSSKIPLKNYITAKIGNEHIKYCLGELKFYIELVILGNRYKTKKIRNLQNSNWLYGEKKNEF